MKISNLLVITLFGLGVSVSEAAQSCAMSRTISSSYVGSASYICGNGGTLTVTGLQCLVSAYVSAINLYGYKGSSAALITISPSPGVQAAAAQGGPSIATPSSVLLDCRNNNNTSCNFWITTGASCPSNPNPNYSVTFTNQSSQPIAIQTFTAKPPSCQNGDDWLPSTGLAHGLYYCALPQSSTKILGCQVSSKFITLVRYSSGASDKMTKCLRSLLNGSVRQQCYECYIEKAKDFN